MNYLYANYFLENTLIYCLFEILIISLDLKIGYCVVVNNTVIHETIGCLTLVLFHVLSKIQLLITLCLGIEHSRW